MSATEISIDETRRRLLKGLTGAATAGGLVAAGVHPTAAAPTDLSDWFENTGNADTIVDETGKQRVTIQVGTDGNGSAFGFGPATVRVDPGTTVVWEWTGKGGRHNVVAADGSFESDYHQKSGATFEHTFERAGVTKYYCKPHKMVGMKGAVVVGDAEVTLGGGGATTATETAAPNAAAAVDPDYGDWFENVSNFNGTVDKTGQKEVRITVGAGGNGGNLAFDPPAVHVDPGTNVIWEWSGKGGQHNVTSNDPKFESAIKSEEGATYALKFDGVGVCKYYCAPHKEAGMKGAVVVGNPSANATTRVDYLETALMGLAGLIVASPFVASEFVERRRQQDDSKR